MAKTEDVPLGERTPQKIISFAATFLGSNPSQFAFPYFLHKKNIEMVITMGLRQHWISWQQCNLCSVWGIIALSSASVGRDRGKTRNIFCYC
jgi:hypothetical protein